MLHFNVFLFLQWLLMRFSIDMADGFLKIERFVDQKDLVVLKSVLAKLACVQAERWFIGRS